MSKHAHTSKISALVSKAPISRSRVAATLLAVGVVAALGYAPAANAASQITSAMIKNQTIGSVDIMPGGVGRSELRKNSVGWSEVQEESLDTSELTNGGVKEEDLDEATREKLNAGGEKGDPGAPGADGKDGVSGYEVVGRSADAKDVTEADGVLVVKTRCDSNGESAIAGGANTTGDVVLTASFPSDIERVGENTEADPSGRWAAQAWTVKVKGVGHVQPYVICAKV